MALRRARLVQHAVHREELAPMLDRAQLVEIDEAPAGGIGQQGVIAPAIPQRLDDLGELGRTAVARGVVGHRLEAVVARRLQVGGGDDVPARAPAAHQVQRGEAARQVVGFVVAGGGGGDQAQVGSGAGHRGEYHGGFERGDRAGGQAVEADRIGQEDRVELAGLGDARDAQVMLDLDEAARRIPGYAPGRGREALQPGVDVQVQAAWWRGTHRGRVNGAWGSRAARPARSGCAWYP